MARGPSMKWSCSRLVVQAQRTWTGPQWDFPRGLESPVTLLSISLTAMLVLVPTRALWRMLASPWFTVPISPRKQWMQLWRFGIKTWAGKRVADRAVGPGGGCQILRVSGVDALLPPQWSSFTEHSELFVIQDSASWTLGKVVGF